MNEEILLKKYKFLFRNIISPEINCNSGWYSIINNMLSDIEKRLKQKSFFYKWSLSVLNKKGLPIFKLPYYMDKILFNFGIAYKDTTFKIIQIKEKFGALRCYYKNAYDDNIEVLISSYEQQSVYTCSLCSKEELPNTIKKQDVIINMCNDC